MNQTDKRCIFDLPEGLRILVTGASGGIGQALLRHLSGRDALIGAHYHKGKDKFPPPIEKAFARFVTFEADLSRAEEAPKLMQSFVETMGGIDILVSLTGDISEVTGWDKISPENWRSDLEVNLTVPFFLAREAMKHMGAGGKIILTGTASAAHGGGGQTLAYGAAKAAIECVTKALARAGAPHGILVNAVLPGLILTEFHTKRVGRDPKDIEERARMCLLKRAGTPEEAASLYVYLMSRGADYMTGACIPVSGGDWL